MEYLYNLISNCTRSDAHVKYLLTPATTSRWPLIDKFTSASKDVITKFKAHFVYGSHDFMNSDVERELVDPLRASHSLSNFHDHDDPEGGHNLYLQCPFETNKLLASITMEKD